MAVPMEKLDDLVADHLEDRLLQPERLETILASRPRPAAGAHPSVAASISPN
jgi:hypothetical protein